MRPAFSHPTTGQLEPPVAGCEARSGETEARLTRRGEAWETHLAINKFGGLICADMSSYIKKTYIYIYLDYIQDAAPQLYVGL